MTANIEHHIISKCGRRKSNEDVERYKVNLTVDGFRVDPMSAAADFFVICDGHGGSEVAEFIAPKLEKYLMRKSLTYPLDQDYISTVYNFLQKSLRLHPQNIAKHCGCTALVVVLYLDRHKDRRAQIINIGDCRSILSRDGLAVPLSIDHKPSWPDEKKRIDKVNLKYENKLIWFDADHSCDGGDFRIGDLSVSRAFGDLDNTPHVTHIPDIYNHRLYDIDEFIILACDGVWDVLRNEEVVNFIRDHRTNNHIELYNIPQVYTKRRPKQIYPNPNSIPTNNIAEKLADYAMARGSGDNISIIIIFFNKPILID